MAVQIIATPVTIADLEAGDLWSFDGPARWGRAMDAPPFRKSPLYIRNNLPAPAHMKDCKVYRITIEEESHA